MNEPTHILDIRPVPDSQRNLKGIDFFLLWAGVGISLAEIWAGGFLAGMGIYAGILAIILGHVIGNTLMAAGGVIGSEYGIMSMVSIRPAFGIRGSNLAAVLNIIQLVGWACIMLIIGGRAGAILGHNIGGILAKDAFWIILIGMGTLFWALLTGKTIWKIVQTVSISALFLVVIVMTWVTGSEIGLTPAKTPPEPMPFMTGLDLVIAMPISWLPLVSDYSRFSISTSRSFWGTFWGYFIISSWMYILGLLASVVTGTNDPGVFILDVMGKIGFAAPALILVVFSTITSDFPDVFSATCSMMNISDKIGPRLFMWIVGILTIVVALFFPAEQYENFLLFIGAMFIPLFGVVLTDYFIIRKQKISLSDIYEEGGNYWYWKGFHIQAIFSWVLGFIVFEAIALSGSPVGSSIPSMLSAGIIYYILYTYTHKKENA